MRLMNKKYLMIGLDDEETKHIASVLNNKTAKRILNFLAETEASESEIAEKLKLPINTAEYNLKNLIKAGFVEKARFLWSSKGRKVEYYKLSNKSILISTKSRIVKSLIPVALITAAGAYLIHFFTRNVYSTVIREPALGKSLEAAGAAEVMAGAEASSLVAYFSSLPAWAWFLIGAWLGLVIFIIWNWRKL